jgi:enoyl-CoA hydratase
MTEGYDDDNEVLVEHHGQIAVIRLNRARHGNAITPEMAAHLLEALAEISADERVLALILASSGKVFSAGADRSVLRSALSTPVDTAPIRRFYDVIAALRAVPVPLIAAVEGAAVGAGLNLVLACDLCVAGENATFDSRFLRIGLHPGGGHTWLLSRALGRQQAARLLLFGGALTADVAQDIGLAAVVTTPGSAEEEALRLCSQAARTDRELLVEAKASLNASLELTFAAASDRELERQLHLLGRPATRQALAAALGAG